MDRRQFIKISGVSAAALGLSACNPGTGSQKESLKESPVQGQVVQNYTGVGLLGYGCMRWPMLGKEETSEVDQQTVNELVDEALSHGVNYFDTAPVYMRGLSELAAATALNRHPREKWLLATKLSNFSDPGYESAVRMYRHSLEIFNTDHIDYYLLHSLSGKDAFDKRFASSGIMDFLLEEREKGHIRNLGFSFHGKQEGFEELLALHQTYHWDFVQIQMNYQDWNNSTGRNTDASILYEKLSELDIPVVIMEPLLGGRLADIPAAQAARLKAVEPERSIASWAFRFCGSFPKVLTVLSGMENADHLRDNLHTFTDFKPLTEEEFALADQVGAEISSYPLIRCTSCQYCMPCPYGIDIPGIFRFYNRTINEGTYVSSSLQKDYARSRRRYLALYDKSVETVRQADHCIRCGRCNKACPQHIRIPAELRRIDKYVEKLRLGEI